MGFRWSEGQILSPRPINKIKDLTHDTMQKMAGGQPKGALKSRQVLW